MQILDTNQKEYANRTASGETMKSVNEDIQIDPLFQRINKNMVGFYIWKIQSNVEILPKEEYGNFYEENAYIIYSASLSNGPISNMTSLERELKPTQPSSSLEIFIHFWLGTNVKKENAKLASTKIVELDLFLEHKTTEYRETQGYESDLFLYYFKKNGINILTGCNHTDNVHLPRLFHIKGKSSAQCIQKAAISWENFNSERVLLLQTTKYIFIWIGKSSSSPERIHAINVANKFNMEIVFVDDGYEQSMDAAKKQDWNSYLSLTERHVNPTDNETVKKAASQTFLKLYEGTIEKGIFRVELRKSGYLKQEDLANRESVYIIDGVANCILIWIGRGNNPHICMESMRHARGFVIKKNYPSHTLIIRSMDGYESLDFTNLFSKWVNAKNTIKNNNVPEQFDPPTIIQRPKLAAQKQLIDDGTGSFEIYKIDNHNNIVKIPKKSANIFFSENCYIIHYQTVNPADSKHVSKHIVYQWIGNHCPQERTNHGDIAMKQICDHLRENVVQFKLTQGLEIAHFLLIFHGKLIIFKGQSTADIDIPSFFILRVSGNCTHNSKAIQMYNHKQNYSTNNCYIIRSADKQTWLWCGYNSTGDEREMAKGIAGELVHEYTLVMESKESDVFLASFGETFLSKLKKPDPYEEQISMNWDHSKICLYVCSLEQDDQFCLEKIVQFSQIDLKPDGIYLLDIGNVIYIWVGNMCVKPELHNLVWTIATTLVSWHPVYRDINMPIGLVKQGSEPITFTGFFDNWSNKLFETFQPYENLRYGIESSGDAPVPMPRFNKSNNDQSPSNAFDKYPKFPLNILRTDANQIPSNVNLTMKEMHLTHDDFVNVFRLTHAEFQLLPKWKQIELKKQYKLF